MIFTVEKKYTYRAKKNREKKRNCFDKTDPRGNTRLSEKLQSSLDYRTLKGIGFEHVQVITDMLNESYPCQAPKNSEHKSNGRHVTGLTFYSL